MKFAKLTALDGNAVWVAPISVQAVRPPLAGEYTQKAGAVVVLSGQSQAVKESPAEVIKALESI